MNEDIIIPLGIVGLVMAVPVVAMLTRHQQRMAELLHRGSEQPAIDPGLAYDIREVKQLVQQHTLMLDKIIERQDTLERKVDSRALGQQAQTNELSS